MPGGARTRVRDLELPLLGVGFARGGVYSDPGSQGCFQPRWSPDGRKDVFARGTSGDNESNIYTVNAYGTNLTQVTHGGADSSPDWGTHPLAR